MMDDHKYPALAKSDKDLLHDIMALLSERVKENAYSDDGSFAAAISGLPVGLRAMAATHHLDVSLAIDDIGWHFLNFGEPHLVEQTKAGLRELGMNDLAEWFAEAHAIMLQFSKAAEAGEFESSGDDYPDWLVMSGNEHRIDMLSKLAWDKNKASKGTGTGSAIYDAWISYARAKPENVFRG